MAEVLLRQALRERGDTDTVLGSAGVGAAEGEPASEGAYLVALEHGADLSAHRSRRLTPGLAADADLILVMSSRQREHLRTVLGEAAAEKVALLGEYAGCSGADAEVQDPFGADLEQYRETWSQLERFARVAAARLRSGGRR